MSAARVQRTLIELSIPMRLMRGAGAGAAETRLLDADDVTCYICANGFCANDECGRTLTHLGCCTQAICCACLMKSCKRCACKDDCDAVISLCPFCREVSPVEALDVFLGSKTACAECRKSDEPVATAAGAPTPASPVPVAAAVAAVVAEAAEAAEASSEEEDEDSEEVHADAECVTA